MGVGACSGWQADGENSPMGTKDHPGGTILSGTPTWIGWSAAPPDLRPPSSKSDRGGVGFAMQTRARCHRLPQGR